MSSSKRIGICVDWVELYGGAEKVLKAMVEIYPNSEIWTLWCNDKEFFEILGISVNESILSKFPNILRRPLSILFAPIYWRTLPNRHYEFILISSHQFAHLAKFARNVAPIFAYVHTPARYIWFSGGDLRLRSLRYIMKPLQLIDRFLNTAQFLAVNSVTVQKRVASNWRLQSTVIYPPVEISVALTPEVFYASGIPNEDFLVCAGRWVPYKKFDLAIEVANSSRMSLVILGGGPDEKRLRKLAERANIRTYFVKNPIDSEYLAIIAKSKALLFPGSEDFGIVPVEAMQLGVPVIGINQGGLLDSVINNVSGFLCEDVGEMITAVGKVDSLSRNKIRLQGEQFSFAIFSNLLQAWIETKITEKV